MKAASPKLMLVLLASVTFTVATVVHLRAVSWADKNSTDGAFIKLLGDGRRLFSGQFVELADVYLHSGFYPSIFDQRDAIAPKAVTGKAEDPDDHDHEENKHDDHDAHEKAMDFMGPPPDWLAEFIRRFRITKHSHLQNGEEREILPWLKMAIELDPQAIQTYTATAFWLRKNLGNTKDAEAVLREGIQNNPNSYEILFQMGLIYKDSYKDSARARNIWRLALRRWEAQTEEEKKASPIFLNEIAGNLARLENEAGNGPQAIEYFELAKLVSPNPEALQKQINEIRIKLARATNSTPVLSPSP